MRAIRANDLVRRVSLGVLAAMIAMLTNEAPLGACCTVAAAPEIDGASLSAGLGLLGAGVLWLRARRRVK